MNEALCIGDFIALISEETGGHLSTSTESDTVSEVSCGPNRKEKKNFKFEESSFPTDVTNRNGNVNLYFLFDRVLDSSLCQAFLDGSDHGITMFTFEICTPNKYEAERKLRKLREADSSSTRELLEAENEAEREEKDNETRSENQQGKKIYYGQNIQLKSVSTQKYVSCTRKTIPDAESSLQTVNLTDANGKAAQFRCGQTMVNNDSGSVVKYGDTIIIESVKDTDNFLHLIRDSSPSSKGYGTELSSTSSEFRVFRTYRPTQNGIHSGSIIQIHHKQLDSILVAETTESSISGDVFLQKTVPDTSGRQTDRQHDPYLSYWQVDVIKTNDGLLHKDNLCRLIHVSTQRFLCLDPSDKCRLVLDKSEGWTLFKLQSTTQGTDIVQQDSCINLQNMDGKCWLFPSQDTFQKSKVNIDKESSFLGTTLQTEMVSCRMIQSTKTEQKAMFQIKEVESKPLKFICFVQELLARVKTFLQKGKKNESTTTSDNQIAFLMDNIIALKRILSSNSTTFSKRNIQSYICESGLLKHLFQVMEKTSTATDQRLKNVYVDVANLIMSCIEGSTDAHKLYAVSYLDFCIQEVRNRQSPMHLKALSIVVGMFQDNVVLVGQIKDRHIDKIFDMFKMDGHYKYFKLLGALCMCDGEPLVRNQMYIASKLSGGDDKQELCYLAYMGEHIGCKENTVYISTNSGQTMVELQDVYKNEVIKLHYHHQLEFFKVLCHGGNSVAVRLLTKELGYITIDLLSRSLMDGSVSPEHRIIYCQLLTVMFIEATGEPVFGQAPSALDFTKLDNQRIPHSQTPDAGMDQIKQWANSIIFENESLVPENNDLNTFLSAILDMVRSLFLYGYYGSNMADHEYCVRGVIKMLEDGTEQSDKGYHVSKGVKMRQHQEHLEMSRPDRGIFMALISALNVIELFFDMATVVLVSKMVDLFKKDVLSRGNTYSTDKDVNGDQFQMRSFMSKQAVTYPFDELRLRGILLDIAETDNCGELVQKSLYTLNRCCSVIERTLAKANRVQLLELDTTKNNWRSIQTIASSIREVLTSPDGSQNRDVLNGAEELEQMCHLREGNPNPVNQMLIYNTGLLEIVFRQIELKSIPGDEVFRLMKSMTRENRSIQSMMFGHLDTLLHNVTHETPGVVETATEIFRGNAELCMKVAPGQIKTIVSLLALLKLPELIELLHVIVQPYSGCSLKRNRRQAISHLPLHRSDIFKCIDGTNKERLRLLNDDTKQDAAYILSLLDCMATCAQDERSFLDTFCARISLREVQEVLSSSVTISVKVTYLRFLTSIYVTKDKNALLETETTWNLIKSFDNVFQSVKENATTEPGLIQRCSSFSVLGRFTMNLEQGVVVYLFDGILPFLKAMFSGSVTTCTVDEQYQADLENLDAVLQTFATDMIPYIIEIPHFMKILRDVVMVVHEYSTKLNGEVNFENILRAFEKQAGSSKTGDILKFQSDIELNRSFQNFTQCWNKFYRSGGRDCYRDKDAKLAEAFLDLPYSEEFNCLVDSFIENTTTNEAQKYRAVSTICKCLLFSSNQTTLHRLEVIELNVKCFQVLRSVLHREIIQLPDSQRQLRRVEEVQNILVQHGCVDCVFSHLRQRQNQVTSQALALLSELLYNRNDSVQVSILKYVTTFCSDDFFQSIHQILIQGIEEYKDRKCQRDSFAKDRKARKASRKSEGKHIKRSQVEPFMEQEPKECFDGDVCAGGNRLNMVVRMLGNMGGSSYDELTNIVRTQPLNLHSYNLVSDCTSLMTAMHTQLDQGTIGFYTDIVRALTLLVSGNAENQSTVVENNGLEAINYILVSLELNDCSTAQILEVKSANVMLARSLIEMNHDNQIDSRLSDLPKTVVEQLDTEALRNDISKMWRASHRGFKRNDDEENKLKPNGDADKRVLKQLCRQYFLLLTRTMELTPLDKVEPISTTEDIETFKSLEMKTLSVELVKDGVSQNHYFNDEMQIDLSDGQREKFCESVDRSTASCKLRGMVSWSADWADRASHRAKVSTFPLGNLFIKSWTPLNVMVILLTLVLIVFISFAFSAQDSQSVKFEHPDYKFRHADKVVYVFGGVHNFISALILVYFVIMESPSIPVFSHMATIPRKWTNHVDSFKTANNWSGRFKLYQQEVNAFNLKSIYYTLFFLCSIAGTIFDGYFFAFHLFHLVAVSSPLQKLFRVLQRGAKLLTMLGLLTLAIVYTYGVIIFLFFRDYWADSFNERHTYNLFQSFVSVLHHGLIERTPHADTTFTQELRYTAFDLSFFLIVTLTCLYLALGIIVDSFAAIRNTQIEITGVDCNTVYKTGGNLIQEENARQDDATCCYICNHRSGEFDQTPGGYRYHIKREHNIWNYVRFLVNLDYSDPAVMTGLETYVLQKLKKNELDFFPNKMSMSLGRPESHLEEKMHQMEMRMADIGARLTNNSDPRPGSFGTKDTRGRQT